MRLFLGQKANVRHGKRPTRLDTLSQAVTQNDRLLQLRWKTIKRVRAPLEENFEIILTTL